LVDTEFLIGKNVIGQAGYDLGEIKGVEIDTVKWNATHLQVKLTNKAADELGFRKRFGSSTVCMPVSLINAVGDVITITKTIGELSRNADITKCPEQPS
jgi:sporulation protein YlmC with PRC-barrel domain